MISTICVSLQCLRMLANISSVTPFGTEAAAMVKSSATRSASLKSGLVRKSHTAASFCSSTPKCSAPPAVCAMQ